MSKVADALIAGTVSRKWQALAQEAELATEHIGIGIAALGRANYAQQAHYDEAFLIWQLELSAVPS